MQVGRVVVFAQQALYMSPDVGSRRVPVHPIDADVSLDDHDKFMGDHPQRRLSHDLPCALILGQRITSELLFPSEAGTPFSAWSKNKRKFNAMCGVSDWTLHDLRRTFATNLARWEITSPETIDRLLNHVSGAQNKVSKLYHRWRYLPQMKAALCAHEKKLAALIAGD
jgi:integrase